MGGRFRAEVGRVRVKELGGRLSPRIGILKIEGARQSLEKVGLRKIVIYSLSVTIHFWSVCYLYEHEGKRMWSTSVAQCLQKGQLYEGQDAAIHALNSRSESGIRFRKNCK